MASLVIHGLDEDLVKVFSELASSHAIKPIILDDKSKTEIAMAKLYDTKVQLVKSQKCYFNIDDKFYFILALYPPAYHYYSHTISKHQSGWYDKKLRTLIAIDEVGNFYYRYSDGSIRHYQHAAQQETIIAKSEKEFLKGIIPISNHYFRD